MNDIARATGYSKATLYVYFKNKEEIIRYPLYFKMVLENINIDFETRDFLPEEKETFLIGESINQLIATYFQTKIESGELRPDIPIVPTLFSCWGMISGAIQLAVNKEEYIQQQLGFSKEEFLSIGFETLYRTIAV